MVTAPLDTYAIGDVFDKHVEDVVIGSRTNDPTCDSRDVALFVAIDVTEPKQLLLRAIGPNGEIPVVVFEPELTGGG